MTDMPGAQGAVAGFASRPMLDGPRGEWGMLPTPAGAAGECPPSPYPPERSDSQSGLGDLGVGGGGGVAEWAKAIPALEVLDYRLL